MKWIGKRISFIDGKDKTTIVIYPEVKTWVAGLMGSWVAMWYAIGAIMIWAGMTLDMTDQEKVITFVFLAFWAYYAIRVSRTFFWLLWGKELLKIDETALTYKKSIKNYGKATPYYFENISKIRMHIPKAKSFQTAWESSPWIRGGERIEFDYMGKTIRMGRKLEEKDAEILFKLVTKRIDERLRKLK